jgi:hypothetical protein
MFCTIKESQPEDLSDFIYFLFPSIHDKTITFSPSLIYSSGTMLNTNIVSLMGHGLLAFVGTVFGEVILNLFHHTKPFLKQFTFTITKGVITI